MESGFSGSCGILALGVKVHTKASEGLTSGISLSPLALCKMGNDPSLLSAKQGMIPMHSWVLVRASAATEEHKSQVHQTSHGTPTDSPCFAFPCCAICISWIPLIVPCPCPGALCASSVCCGRVRASAKSQRCATATREGVRRAGNMLGAVAMAQCSKFSSSIRSALSERAFCQFGI